MSEMTENLRLFEENFLLLNADGGYSAQGLTMLTCVSEQDV